MAEGVYHLLPWLRSAASSSAIDRRKLSEHVAQRFAEKIGKGAPNRRGAWRPSSLAATSARAPKRPCEPPPTVAPSGRGKHEGPRSSDPGLEWRCGTGVLNQVLLEQLVDAGVVSGDVAISNGGIVSVEAIRAMALDPSAGSTVGHLHPLVRTT